MKPASHQFALLGLIHSHLKTKQFSVVVGETRPIDHKGRCTLQSDSVGICSMFLCKHRLKEIKSRSSVRMVYLLLSCFHGDNGALNKPS